MAGSVLVFVAVKFVKNWQAEYAKFLDTDDQKLNLKIYIGYRSVTLNEKIRISEKMKMITPRETQSIINISKYFIITLLISYKNNVLYYLSINKTGFIIVPKKKRWEFCLKSTAQDVWNQIFWNKYYKKKKKKQKECSYVWSPVQLILSRAQKNKFNLGS